MSRAAHDTARAMLDAGMTPAEAADVMVKKPFQFQRREIYEALTMLQTVARAASPANGDPPADAARGVDHEPAAITDEAPEVVASALEAAGYTRLPASRADQLEVGDVVIVHMRPGSLAVSRWRRGG